MNEEMKEMAKIICKVCSQCDLDCLGGKAEFPCALAEIQAEKLYDAGYRKINQTYEQLQEENARLHERKDYLESFIVEKGWQEYVGEETPEIVWHKVENGDLPKENKKLLWVYYKDFFDKSFYYGLSAYENKQFDFIDVIAWAELPKYEGEQ